MPAKIGKFITFVVLIAASNIIIAQKDTIPDHIYYPPSGEQKNTAIMLLGGAEGGLPNYYKITRFTSMGYPCFVVGYFGTKNTPDRLEMIPLEYFENVIDTIKSKVGDKKIIVWGGSKGGELALLLASRYKEIRGVLAAVPSAVVFQGIGGRPVSSWSYKGESIPFVPYVNYDWSKIVNNKYVEMYRQSLEQTEAVDKAAIKVENINGPILILTGEEDTMWPSSQMGEMIVKRLDENNFPYWYKHFSYKNAGHTLNDTYIMGGTAEGNQNAKLDSEQRVLDFLKKVSQQR